MTPITNFVLRSIYSLPPRLRGLPRVSAWLASYALEVQAIETTIADIRAGLNLDTADRVRLGKLRIVPDDSVLSLEQYRSEIKAEIQIRRSHGGIENVRAAALAYGPGTVVYQIPGGGLRAVALSVGAVSDARLVSALDRSAAAGVPLIVALTVGNDLRLVRPGDITPVKNCPPYVASSGHGCPAFGAL